MLLGRMTVYGLKIHFWATRQDSQVPSPCLTQFPHLHIRMSISALSSSQVSLHPKPQQSYGLKVRVGSGIYEQGSASLC